MKKLLIITQHFPPEIGAASNRMSNLIPRLKGKGYELFIVTSQPCYPHPNLYQDVGDDYVDEKITIIRTPIVKHFLSERALKFINQCLFVFFALFAALFLSYKHSVKICFTTSPPFLINIVGLFTKSVLGMRWVMEVRDLWPDSMVAVNMTDSKSLIFRQLKKLEYMSYKTSDRIVVVTESTKDILVKNGIDGNKISVITNGIPDWVKVGDQREFKNIKGSYEVMYVGNMGLAQGLDLLVEVAYELRVHPNIHFYFIGEGIDRTHLIKTVEKLNLKNITFIDAICDKNELLSWYKRADLGIVSLKKADLFQSVIPSKIFEYAAIKVPILLIGSGEGSKLIEEYQIGYSVDHDKKKIAEKMLALLNNSNPIVQEQGFQKINQDYSWHRLIEKYVQIFDSYSIDN